MLGKTADGLTWMSRYIERAENSARLLETGLRMSLVRTDRARGEWSAIATAAGIAAGYEARHGQEFFADNTIDFMLRDPTNPSSTVAVVEAARTNARMVRTAITREVWEAINDFYHDTRETLRNPVSAPNLPDVLERLRRHGAMVRGTLQGTMLRNETFDFTVIGTHLERADNTARILDVKYHVLLPDAADVGGPLDIAQWEQLLRSVHVNRAYMTVHGAEYRADLVAEFLILDRRMPRSLMFCAEQIDASLRRLAAEYGDTTDAHAASAAMLSDLSRQTVVSIFRDGLHDFLTEFLEKNASLALQIASAYRFSGQP